MLPLAQSFFGWIDITVVVTYLAVLIAIGAYFARRQKNMEDYFLAGRSMGWLPVGMSLMAALNSGLDYLAAPFSVFKYGLIFMLGFLSWLLLYPWVAWVTMPFYRRLNILSAYEYLEMRFNAGVRFLAACIFLFWRTGWMATALFVPSLVIHTTVGLPLWATVILLGSFVTVYTVLGGVEGIIWTDVIQFCLMLAGVVVTLAITISAVPGGITGIWEYAASHGKTDLYAPMPETAQTLGQQLHYLFTDYRSMVGVMLAVLVGRAATYTCEQSTVQRFKATRSLRHAKNAFLVNAAGDTFWMVGLSFVGMALYAYFKGVLPPGVREDALTIHFMREAFPSGLNGLVVAAVLASGLSAIDASINACTSVIMADFYKPYVAPWLQGRRAAREAREARADAGARRDGSRDGAVAAPGAAVLPYAEPGTTVLAATGANQTEAEQRHDLKVSRIATVAFAGVGMALATQVQHLGDIIVIAQKAIQTFTGPLLGLFLLGMFSRRTHAIGVLVGGVVGLTTALYVAFGTEIGFVWPTVFGWATTIAFGYVLSLILPGEASEHQRQLTWRNVMKMRETDEVAAEAAAAARSASAPATVMTA
jgi:SSS family transporter